MSIGRTTDQAGVQFHSELSVTPIPTPGTYWNRLREPKRWRLNHALRFEFYGMTHVIPAGFECDFASVPRPLKFLFSDDACYGYAAFVHDYLYRTGCVPKFIADAIFFDLLKEKDRQPAAVAWLLWKGVYLFGGPAWRENMKNRK